MSAAEVVGDATDDTYYLVEIFDSRSRDHARTVVTEEHVAAHVLDVTRVSGCQHGQSADSRHADLRGDGS